MLRIISMALLVAVTLSACSSLVPDVPDEDLLTLHVASYTVPCVGEAPRTCMLVSEQPDAAWELFYDPIEGFTYAPGWEYTLRVARREVEHPPADGSSRSHRLVRMVAKRSVPQPEGH